MTNMEEITWEQQRQFWENETKAFEVFLIEEGKLKEDTVKKHVFRMDFVMTEYFVRYEISYADVTGETIVDFVGRFLISHVLTTKESDIGAYLTSFKKWIQFLQTTSKISKEQYTSMIEVCKYKSYFDERFDEYMHADNDYALERWLNSNDIEYHIEQQTPPDKRKLKPLVVDTKLQQLWMDGRTAVPQIVSEFKAFLEAVRKGSNVKLSAARKHLPRKFWHELDEQLNMKLIRKPTLNQDQEPVFQFFFYVAIVLGMTVEGIQLEMNEKQVDSYLALSEQQQATILLDALWNRVNWGILQEVNEGGRPEDIQAWRRAIASVLASWPVKREHIVDQEWKKHRQSGILLDTGVDVFLHAVATVLVRFGLITATYPPESEMKYGSMRQPALMAVQESGNRVFRYFVNEAAYVLNSAPVAVAAEAKIGRNDPCSCGSGKKYKKCCL
ncbi:YecA family protein [Paenibacillus roseipurpureus]|uniref:SEC-C metal-binding domain-containing protein n=1 Tax=Paenibacillus roseopurpureus TaxID=2918901 RepID=A0AA96LSE5_9BACL|nr:SEC-C metal-binding domain-containing protein [Paenibacillus sp. MBLB1832]WNR43870.1 SEC-C metal-binding domain-containing protein [Paenibacillus sp. MBLB1832]